MPQRMRYRWFVDRPRNVSRQDYDRYQLVSFAAVGSGLFTLMLLFGAVSGVTQRNAQKLAEIDTMTVQEALAYEGEPLDLIKLEGFLVAEPPLTMPDDEARQVVRGQLQIIARNPGSSGEETDASAPSENGDNSDSAISPQESSTSTPTTTAIPPSITLWEWEERAETVFLSDGDRQIPLAFDLAVLPVDAEAGDIDPEYVREGDSARTSRAVAIQYGDEVLPLPPEYLEQRSTVPIDVERALLPQGASAIIVAGLDTAAAGNQLVDPLGDRLMINLGTEAELQEQGQFLQRLYFILMIPAGVVCVVLGRIAWSTRQEFVRISNE
ncbi:MAG: hypothetical protein ACFBSG_16075 [Leptolyngbyaceae cyanobacterium]